jgi:hypothetical protein
MSYNGSGTFNINTTGQPVVAGTVISSSAFNSLTSDLATGLSTAITKDGQTTTTARITFAQGITSSLVTDSSSVSTGSIITDGGVGIAKNLYVGGTLNVTGSTALTNPVINNIKMGYTTTATAAGTTTLTVSSNYRQFFTGSTTQTIVLPVTSTLVTGIAYEIENNSTGLLTVNSSGGNLVGTIPAGVCAHAVCIGTTLTTAADWDWDYISTTTITGTGANVLGTSPTIATPTITGDATISGLTVGKGGGAVSTNTALGTGALNANTTASSNVAVGYQAGYTQTTAGAGGGSNVHVGYRAGYSATGYYNTFLGTQAGQNSTGNGNTFVGSTGTYASGQSMTSGSNNTILGNYSGNNGGLDLRTASNYVVLSDGDGNPLISTNSTRSVALNGAVPQTGTGITFPATQSASSDANTLDDYEEGTWTPNQGDGLTVGGTFSSSGNYTKVGRLVYVRGYVTGSGSISCSTGTTITKNLPFTTLSGTDNAGSGFNGALLAGTVLDFVNLNVYTTAAIANGGGYIYFSGTYQTS